MAKTESLVCFFYRGGERPFFDNDNICEFSLFIVLLAILVLTACIPAMSCDSCACDVTCSPYQANLSIQINVLQQQSIQYVAWG